MPFYDTHLCLVSAQATPNLLPLLDGAWQPRRVVLACSVQMKEKAQALRSVIQTKGAGMTVEILDLPDAYNYAALSDAFLNYLAAHADDNIALNVTGGTKLMAVAAQEVFRSEGKPVFYVNVESDEVLVIGKKAASQPLRAKLKVHEILTAHGYQVTTQEQPQITRELRDLTARLIDHVASAGQALGTLNALARAARSDKILQVELTPYQIDSRALGDILALFTDAGLARLQGRMLTFRNEDARFFANGGWLEAHVYEALQSLRSQFEGLSDVAMGVRVGFDGAKAKSTGNDKNEIDVAFLYRNTLHLIECKTANLAQPGSGNDDKATEAIYKMESLLKLGGLRTRGMVVDYRGNLSQSPANRKRAEEARIAIVSGPQLKDLKGAITRLWLSDHKPGANA
ncbi:MAG: DUF1887 family CARF protein [Polaromonas sp.]